MSFFTDDLRLEGLFRRCVVCPSTTPSCPQCDDGKMCSIIPYSCDACASTACISVGDSGDSSSGSTSSSHSSGPNIGAIVGGVLGGIAFIVIVTYVVWRFCLKGRRQQYEEEQEWPEESIDEKAPSEFTMRRDARASTHTVASLASTVLTRASNIIQIAYIPGVTQRSGPQSPGLLVPPVPPIPIMTTASSTGSSSPYSTEDQHFFVPGDLRDSTYSGYTDYSDNRTSIAPSLARSSVATTLYRNNAIVSPLPAQTVVRGKAAVVSVKSSQSSPTGTPNPDTPPVPQIDTSKFASVKSPLKIQMPASTENAGAGPNNPAPNAATVGKPTPLTITKKGKAVLVRTGSTKSEQSPASATPATPADTVPAEPTSTTTPRPPTAASSFLSESDSDSESESEHARSRRSLLRAADRNSYVESPAIGIGISPFADMSSSIGGPDAYRGPNRRSGLSTVHEGTDDERSRRNSRFSGNSRGSARMTESPFGDENAVNRS